MWYNKYFNLLNDRDFYLVMNFITCCKVMFNKNVIFLDNVSYIDELENELVDIKCLVIGVDDFCHCNYLLIDEEGNLLTFYYVDGIKYLCLIDKYLEAILNEKLDRLNSGDRHCCSKESEKSKFFNLLKRID